MVVKRHLKKKNRLQHAFSVISPCCFCFFFSVHGVFVSVRVSDLQKDVPAVNEYLVDELNFSPEAASALLSSTYSIRVVGLCWN